VALALALPAHAQSTPDTNQARTGQQDNTQDNTQARSPAQTTEMSTVIVTGTRADNRTKSSSLTPIDVIPSQILEQTGTADFGKALEQTVPSMNFPQFGASDTFAFQRPFELRGLSPDQTLVLINGKRMHVGALLPTLGQVGQGAQSVDLNSIPMAAIDHVEVLRDGASAQYGSDAIAGVVNVILKSGVKGGDVRVSGGEYSTGNGRRWQASTNFGVPLTDKGWLRITASMNNQDKSNRAGIDVRPGFPALGTKFYFGITPFRGKNVLLNMQYDFTPDVSVYAFGHWDKRVGNPRAFYRYGANAPIPKSPLMAEIFPDGNGFLPIEHGVSYDYFMTLGLKGHTDGGFRWDVSANTGANRVSYNTWNSINFAYWYDFGASPRDMHDGNLSSALTTFDADFSQDLGENWVLSFGEQYMRQAYRVRPGEKASWYVGTSGFTGGAQGFAGWGPQDAVNASRHDVSEYVQLEGNITDRLSTSLSARHEDYSDFGTTTSFAASGRFDFTPEFALRGSASTGFRAPSLGQQHYAQTSSTSFPEGNDLGLPEGIYLRGIVPVGNELAKLLGSEPLKPEKSRNYTFGMVWNPTTSFTTTVDLFYIRIRNLIALSSTISVSDPNVRSYLADHGIANPDFVGLNYFTNAGTIRDRGIGWMSSYHATFDNGGALRSTLSMSYHKTEVGDIRPNPPVLDQFGNVGFQRLTRSAIKGTLSDTMPRSKVIWTNSYDLGHWGFVGTATRYGRFTSYSSTDYHDDVVYSHKWLVDLSLNYYLDRWTFTLGGDNVFNTYPDKNPPGQDTHGVYPYPTSSPFGYFGAYVYGRVMYRW
jgi:iron complex outermembrane receptor protein